MDLLYLVKIGEIALKSGNRHRFETKLKGNILDKLSGHGCSFSGREGRYFLECAEDNGGAVYEALSTTFGVTGFAPVVRTQKNLKKIDESVLSLAEQMVREGRGSGFKIEARRSDKSFELTSYELACRLGDIIRNNFKNLYVNVQDPAWTIHCEIRDTALVYPDASPGPGGLPVGTAGSGTLLLSGGIDSPVAGYVMAKRGLKIDAVYFHTHPFTSEDAKDKVKQLARTLAPYCSGIRLFVVPFTEAQLHIRKNCREEEITLLMRACMMRIAEILAERNGSMCLITGEALSQVASQTLESLTFTGSIPALPVLRPLIGFDKEEIIRTARDIGTFDISVLPYDDCCTLFAPEHTLIKPDLQAMKDSYRALQIEEVLRGAASAAEALCYGPVQRKNEV
jgi:thiamine biosynthesis protein ThiI